jgi:Ca-activated chloride channel family protein
MRLKVFILTIVSVAFALMANAQPTGLVKKGNKLYEQKKYKEATEEYVKAVSKNPNYTPGMFNLGNALYQQKQYDGARKVLDNAVKLDTNRIGKSAANYNIGTTYMAEQKWEEAIDAYKKTLRTNPQDADAKYNLSYAQQMLKKQGGGGKNNKDNKDDKKDEKNKDKNQQNKDDKKKDDKKDEQNKDQQNKDDKKDEQDKKPEPQASKLNEKQAEQLLNALQQEEKKLQDKHKKAKGVPVKVEKDW